LGTGVVDEAPAPAPIPGSERGKRRDGARDGDGTGVALGVSVGAVAVGGPAGTSAPASVSDEGAAASPFEPALSFAAGDAALAPGAGVDGE
jgi:hypothetical protein